MYIGHYAAALVVTAIRPRRGVLTYAALSAALPDLFMLGTGTLAARWNYHADLGLLVCVGVVVLVGILCRFDVRTIGLAFGCLFAHLILDIPYVSRDQSNLYAHPWIDFALEGALLLVAGGAFIRRTRPSRRRRLYFLGVLATLLLLQGVWDLSARSFHT